MKLIDTISGTPAVAMLGMCKNAGKTTAMNTLIRDHTGTGTLCVTSIGMDGESRDRVTGTKKPAIWIREGMLAATAENLLPFCDVSREILSATGIFTGLGEVIVFRAQSDGFVQLAGPSIAEQLGILRDILKQFGTDRLLIDGALNRKSPLVGVMDGVCILSTGASLDRDMDRVVSETAYTAELLSLPLYSGKIILEPEQRSGAVKQIEILHEDGTEERLQRAEEIRNISGHDSIIFPGALTESIAGALLKNKSVQNDVTIVCKDSSCLLMRQETWQKLISRNVRFAVQKRTDLAAVTVNPVSAGGWIFDPGAFLERMRAAVRIPVFDVMGDREN